MMKMATLLFLSVLGVLKITALPQFEVYWESQYSYDNNNDEQHNPWYIDLGNINSGSQGNLQGPNIVTIAFADVCAANCQEDYPDEFCSKYPPEGIPHRPRTVDDWGTKFNITSEMMTKGIAELKSRGTEVHLSYGIKGLKPLGGGGEYTAAEDSIQAERLVKRIAKNVADWGFEGVDIYTVANSEGLYTYHGLSASFHYYVFKKLRRALPREVTISYTLGDAPRADPNFDWNPVEEVVASAHRYLDYVNVHCPVNSMDLGLDETIEYLVSLGVPTYKIGWLMVHGFYGSSFIDRWEEMMPVLVDSIRNRGLRGLSLFSVNMEIRFHGEFLQKTAEYMYL